jgi:F0F1-type ATP synthase membrane subunit b/b'
MTPARKLTFQLASLLDLLLIVMFALYLEMQTVAQQQTEQVEAERTTAASDGEALRRQLAELQQELTNWREKQRDSEHADQANREQLGTLIREVFRIPEATVQKIAQRRDRDDAGLTPAEITSLKKELQTLATSRGDQVVDHLLTFAEMKKRFDVWEVYLQENGALVVNAGSHQRRLQTGAVESPDQFSEELFRLYKSFPQTKSIVLILVSYGDSRLIHRHAVIKGLPLVTERMRADSNGVTRFEYAVLGYRPEAAPER